MLGVTIALLVGFPRADAQSGVPSTPSGKTDLRQIPTSSSDQAAPPTYELSAKWDDRGSGVLTVPFKNFSDRSLEIIGVQATGGLFIADFPSKIASGKEDALSAVYVPVENSDGDFEQIRIYTDQGTREIWIKVVRDAVVKLDTRELVWTTGAPAETRSITLSVATGTVRPVRVKAVGGHHAVLEPAGDGVWRIKVTPASTAKSGKFLVVVDFDKTLPGLAPVILGVIQPRE